MLTRAEVERLDTLCSAATAGPWVHDGEDTVDAPSQSNDRGAVLLDTEGYYAATAHDLALIAESRTALPAALATIRELVAALRHARLCPAHGPPCDRCDSADVILAAWDGAPTDRRG